MTLTHPSQLDPEIEPDNPQPEIVTVKPGDIPTGDFNVLVGNLAARTFYPGQQTFEAHLEFNRQSILQLIKEGLLLGTKINERIVAIATSKNTPQLSLDDRDTYVIGRVTRLPEFRNMQLGLKILQAIFEKTRSAHRESPICLVTKSQAILSLFATIPQATVIPLDSPTPIAQKVRATDERMQTPETLAAMIEADEVIVYYDPLATEAKN